MNQEDIIQKQIAGKKFTSRDIKYFIKLYSFLEDTDLSRVNLSDLHFDHIQFRRVNFNNTNLDHTIFDKCTFIDCTFENLKCNNTHFYDCTFIDNYFYPPIGKISKSSIIHCKIIMFDEKPRWVDLHF